MSITASLNRKGTRNLDTDAPSSREGWAAGILVTIMLMAVTGSVANANWADGVWLTPYAAIAGLFFGLLVTRLRLPSWLAHLLMLLEGAFVTALFISTLVQPTWATWNERMVIMESRLAHWLNAVLGGGTGTDALLFVMLLCALSWFIGYLAAWSVFHSHEPWGAILPSGAALLLNLFYSAPQSGLFLMLFLLCAMLLLVRTTLLKRQDTWRRMSIRFANDIGYDFLTYGVVFSGIIILASWLVPPSAPGPQWLSVVTDRVRGPWQDVGENLSRMFSTVRNVNTGGPTTLFSSSLAMGGPIHLGQRPVLDISAPAGRYWGAVAFDRYTGTGWVNSVPQSDSFAPNDPRLQGPPIALAQVLTQTVKVLLPGDNYVVAASQLMQVSESTDARYGLISPASNQIYQDVTSLRIQRSLKAGDSYRVVSAVSRADEASLRSASTSYPQYVVDRYLALPQSVPARVHDLAFKLTSAATSNYDKARAIESYLRQNIKYDESVDPPPPDVDAVDYTLFERPAGYCNYYASAMAVLAREIGIPARVVSGYAQSDATLGVFHIIEGNAHSWPELYFSNFGWIQFEPTASKPVIVRPAKSTQISNPGDQSLASQPEDILNRQRLNLDPATQNRGTSDWISALVPSESVRIVAGAGSGTILLLLVALVIAQLAWTQRVRLLSPAGRAWEEMWRFARLAGFQERSQSTPFERAEELARVLPDARPVIVNVTDLYVREKYGKQPLSHDEQSEMQQARALLGKRMLRGIFDNVVGKGPVRLVNSARRKYEQLRHRGSAGDKPNA